MKNEEYKSEKMNGSKPEAAENGHKNEKNLEHGVVDNMYVCVLEVKFLKIIFHSISEFPSSQLKMQIIQ